MALAVPAEEKHQRVLQKSRSLFLLMAIFCVSTTMSLFARGAHQNAPQPAVPPPLYGVDFSPYEQGQDPNVNPQVSATQIQARLQIVAPYVSWVRSFSSTTGLENIPPLARSLGLKVAAGAWISTNLTQNAAEVSSLIAAANAGNVDIAIVGSEVLLRGDISESQLIAYMHQVRQAIPASIPVTTADTYGTLLAHPNVIAASDVVAGNFYPYWEGQAVANAVCDLIAEYNQLVSAAGGKPVIISETGWPSGGDAQGAAVPSPANAGQYALQFVSWARSNNVPYFYFEALDEAWKANHEGPQGAYWGIWDQTGTLKPSMQPVIAGQTAPVVCNGIPGGPGVPQISLTYVPPYGSSDQLEGQALHVSTSGYAVAVYIQVSGGWWIKPTFAQPVTSLQADGTWSSAIVTGGSDQLATSIAAFLIPNSYSPPPLSGQSSLPAELYQNSVANVQVSRSQSSISGQITNGEGLPLGGVAVALGGAENAMTNTTADGKYSFPNLSTSGPYTVTPSGGQQIYAPPSQSFSNISGNQVANFSAMPVTSASTGLRFVPMGACRVVDTRNSDGFSNGFLPANTPRDYILPNTPNCSGIPSNALAYSFNVTVVPRTHVLSFLTLWQRGQARPIVSILNSGDARIKANAAIVPADTSGAISVFSTDDTELVLDINGYFVDSTASSYNSGQVFYPITPCRVVDTRNANGSFGGPSIDGLNSRSFPISSSSCTVNVPASAQSYVLNVTAIPKSGTLTYLTAWPTNQNQPVASILNAPTGTVMANAAIIPAGNGSVSVYVSNSADVVIDISGYFGPPGSGGLSLYTVTPCRAFDTRTGSGAFVGTLTPPPNVGGSSCAPPSAAQAYVFNATVVPQAPLAYLTLWQANTTQPLQSTLNADDATTMSNMAFVLNTNGSVSAYASNSTNLILDIFGYWAP